MSRIDTRQEPIAEAPHVAQGWLAGLRKEQAVFERRLPQLLKSHRGEYVAIYRGRIIAHGPDDGKLAYQMYTKFGNVPFLIARVEEEPTVYEIPSPEIEQSECEATTRPFTRPVRS
ncbi:MAG: hypothetical protein FJ291_18535 [Planctomycetes bacterium]|nr:hypothetical protein [Planctomycetota bacterium]